MQSPTITPKPIGRPSKYNEEYCQELLVHMAQGYSFEAFGAVVHTTKATLHAWLKQHPEFLYAKELAESYNRHFWESQAIDNLIQTDGVKFNSVVWVFNMKNRFGWRDQRDIEVTAGENTKLDAVINRLVEDGVIKKPNGNSQ